MTPNFLEAGVAIYVALAVALSVWLGIFIYLWRIDAQARELKRQLERDRERARAAPSAPRATVTRVSPAGGEADTQRLHETVSNKSAADR